MKPMRRRWAALGGSWAKLCSVGCRLLSTVFIFLWPLPQAMPLGFVKLLKGLGGGRVHEAELQPGSTVKAYGVVQRLGAGQFAVVSSAQSRAPARGHFLGRRARCQSDHISMTVVQGSTEPLRARGAVLPAPPPAAKHHVLARPFPTSAGVQGAGT